MAVIMRYIFNIGFIEIRKICCKNLFVCLFVSQNNTLKMSIIRDFINIFFTPNSLLNKCVYVFDTQTVIYIIFKRGKLLFNNTELSHLTFRFWTYDSALLPLAIQFSDYGTNLHGVLHYFRLLASTDMTSYHRVILLPWNLAITYAFKVHWENLHKILLAKAIAYTHTKFFSWWITFSHIFAPRSEQCYWLMARRWQRAAVHVHQKEFSKLLKCSQNWQIL